MRAVRVRSRAQFAALRSAGRRSRRRAIQVTHVPAEGPPAVAYAIGRAVGTAVVRNRQRRRLRAIVAGRDLAGGTYLIAVSPAAADLGSTALAEQLDACLADLRDTTRGDTTRSGSPR